MIMANGTHITLLHLGQIPRALQQFAAVQTPSAKSSTPIAVPQNLRAAGDDAGGSFGTLG